MWELRYSHLRWTADTAGPYSHAVTYKIADCRQERRAAFRLVHDAYVRAGWMRPNRYGLRVTPHHLLPTTDVLIAKYQEQVIYSLTLISDDQRGLPLASMYPAELDQLRQRHLYLAEVTAVAARPHCLTKRRMFNVFVNLMGLTFQYACSQGIDRLVIAVHRASSPCTAGCWVSTNLGRRKASHRSATSQPSPPSTMSPAAGPISTLCTAACMLTGIRGGNCSASPCCRRTRLIFSPRPSCVATRP